MGMLVDGKWVAEDRLSDERGRFVRRESRFRRWVTSDGSGGFAPEPGRYHLYISWACPWAHRTAIVRRLKGLEGAISLSSVLPRMGEDGWEFAPSGEFSDPLYGARYLREIYLKADPRYTGRVTTPVLWDRREATIVNNESREIMRMLDTEFERLATTGASFYPEELREEVDRALDELYEPVNNGVYRAGFAATQEAYDEAVTGLFDALDRYEELLGRRRYLLGGRVTEADWAFFTTLVRFDPVYHYHFKCNLRRISDYPNLWGYLRDLYQRPGVAETVRLDHIKEHYYTSHASINPSRIVPKGPVLDLSAPHGRERLGG
ncbi:glutathione S-transferase-like protein [Rubrobacter xylanophilus DSM 9941]|uniref:Glutathione S-transferase-like protein n=2 Tax=Rubrobacter xylanophilus TaxID=49319 RepID=Q1AUH3_RUBXD|nr:glutathione S-transferase-like protein [Rubrobacter xylanophilus DSM 9941]